MNEAMTASTARDRAASQRTYWTLALSIPITAIVVMLAMGLGRSDKTVSRLSLIHI
jgi:hypothetical protein